jgi:hypothetical protein
MFNHDPSEEEIAKWFASFRLHDGLSHDRYIGGIVVIENKDRGKSMWVPYVNATARIAYFWDWVERNGYLAEIATSEPIDRPTQLPDDKVAQLYCVRTSVTVVDSDGNLVRSSNGSKQVASLQFRRGFNGKPGYFVPDVNAMMKAETGSLARALGMMGMLSLPGSGIATAEDMNEYLASVDSTVGDDQKRAAPNPKK